MNVDDIAVALDFDVRGLAYGVTSTTGTKSVLVVMSRPVVPQRLRPWVSCAARTAGSCAAPLTAAEKTASAVARFGCPATHSPRQASPKAATLTTGVIIRPPKPRLRRCEQMAPITPAGRRWSRRQRGRDNARAVSDLGDDPHVVRQVQYGDQHVAEDPHVPRDQDRIIGQPALRSMFCRRHYDEAAATCAPLHSRWLPAPARDSSH